MIDLNRIYDATNRGKDIVKWLYPQAEDGKKFCLRDEKTASAVLHEYETKQYGKVWGITDFGDDGWKSPIDLFMESKNMGQNQFYEALQLLAQQFNLCETVNAKKNTPVVDPPRSATSDEKDGTRKWEAKDFASPEELNVLGRTVKQEHLDALGWKSLAWVSYTKDGKTTVRHSTEDYPFFVRECIVKDADGDNPEERFYKIYEPLNADKGFRFHYYPSGAKPQRYVNGLHELKAAFKQYNDKKREEFYSKDENKDKVYEERKLPCAFICSGERDSLCLRSLGYHPLWFNSETYNVSDEEIAEIMEYVYTLYNIPDIDDTGIKKGKELALRFIELKTIWLPQSLRNYRDHRGNPRKDFRDWMDLHPHLEEFRELMKRAKTAKFWTGSKNKGSENRYSIDTVNLHYFLKLNGFSALKDKTDNKNVKLIHMDGYIVEEVTVRDIRDFIRCWVDREVNDHEVMNLILSSTKLAMALDSLPEKELDFTTSSPTKQTFFFPNYCALVSGSGIDLIKRKDYRTATFVWADRVIPHDFSCMDDFFSITHTVDDEDNINFNLDVKNVGSNVMGYIINCSRLYWRKEMEQRFKTLAERRAYAESHKFDLFGEGLSDEEIGEQVQNFINKVFVIGYMLHGFKSPSRPWAPFAMDNRIGEDCQANGGSGKSFFFKLLKEVLSTVTISGKDPKVLDNNHVFERIKPFTQMVVVSDCSKYMDIERFYDSITDEVIVNPKNFTSYEIKFEEAPKWAFTTNYVPSNFDPSSVRRSLFMVFSDYYHEKTEENDYLESRGIRDDFGKDLLTSTYDENDWNADLNFLLQCEKFYLSTLSLPGIVKILPPMKNIVIRKNLSVMGDSFKDWAESYFSLNSGRLNKYLVKDEVFNACKISTGMNNLKAIKFKKMLKAFVEVTSWVDELNPADMLNDGNRIKQRMPGYEVPVEVIYLKSSEAPFL